MNLPTSSPTPDLFSPVPDVTVVPSETSSTTDHRLTGDIRSRIDATLDELSRLATEMNDVDEYHTELPSLSFPPGFRLSIVVPVFNEQKTIRQIVARLLSLSLPLELILVDDASTDGTRQQLETLRDLPQVRVIMKDQNEGKGAALRTGFAHARGDIILVQDADLEYDPRDIPRLLEPILHGTTDVVFGSRFLECRGPGTSSVHRFGNRALTAVSNLTTGLRLTDMETCYKVFRRNVIEDLPLQQNRFGFEPEITAKLARRGHRVLELPIRYSPRAWDEGKKIGMRDAFNAIYCILRYAWTD